jgi:hypothetical protein
VGECEFCGYEFDVDRLGRYGCANCLGVGLTFNPQPKTQYQLPNKGDKAKLWGCVAGIGCRWPEGCGKAGQVSHSNALADGKGRSIKAAEWMVANLCDGHHVEIDSGRRLPKAERRELWLEAFVLTHYTLNVQGKLRGPFPIQRGSIQEWADEISRRYASGELRPA